MRSISLNSSNLTVSSMIGIKDKITPMKIITTAITMEVGIKMRLNFLVFKTNSSLETMAMFTLIWI